MRVTIKQIREEADRVLGEGTPVMVDIMSPSSDVYRPFQDDWVCSFTLGAATVSVEHRTRMGARRALLQLLRRMDSCESEVKS